jgi:aryl-alcohol dehydrogenase-like predicted oxidoreductase
MIRVIGSVEVSALTFGSMRIHERSLDDAAWERLLRASFELGVTTLHSSTEYESYPRFLEILRRFQPKVRHIVKLAEPHFGDAAFDDARLRSKVDGYLADLGAERLDVVQWMWRGDLKDESGRLAGYKRQLAEIGSAFDTLRRAGKIGAVAPFPYTAGFADAVTESGTCEALAVYLNPVEQEMAPQIARAHAAGMHAIAIRPFAAGKALAGATPGECVQSVLRHPGVATAVVSYSTLEHLTELAEAAATA